MLLQMFRVTEEARFTATKELYRRPCCTRRRMQLVVMATVLALLGARQGSSSSCHPVNIGIPVEICGDIRCISTTICAGQCYHEDPVYIGNDDWAEQKVCGGDWSYETKLFEGCPVPVTYPVARNCKCAACNAGNTYCGRFTGHMPTCPPV